MSSGRNPNRTPTSGLEIGKYDFDDDLIESAIRENRPFARAYGVPTTVIALGRSSKPEIELDVEACVADRVPILRRRGGGCAVVLDRGNAIVSAAFPVGGISNVKSRFSALTDWLIEILHYSGLDGISKAGHSDLVIGDRKIAGSCLNLKKGLTYFTASILVTADLSLISKYLKHPPREPEYRRKRSHADFLATLESLAGVKDTGEFISRVDAVLRNADLGELVKRSAP
jgi:lipoate-protein ligase A